jgi:tRNA-dihydrouridine synthase
LNSIPIDRNDISSLSKAMIAEDFEKFGMELTKSISKITLSKNNSNPSKVQYIHSLMWKLFGALNAKTGNEDDSKYIKRLGINRSKMDFDFELAEGNGKTHYIIELNELRSYEYQAIEYMALEGLNDIFNLNNYQHILEAGKAAAVMMGMSIYDDQICLATLKINIENKKITKATAIKHQRFWMDEDGHRANLTEQREYSINVTEVEMKANLSATEKENTELYNKKMDQGFAIEINSIRQEAKKSSLKVKSSDTKEAK